MGMAVPIVIVRRQGHAIKIGLGCRLELGAAAGAAEKVFGAGVHVPMLGGCRLHRHAANRIDCHFAPSKIDLAPYTLGGYIIPMDDATKKTSQTRLKRIEGQVRGVARMVEEDRYCIDVLTQLRAVQAALGKVEQEILREHLNHCVAHALHSGTDDERTRMIEEVIQVLEHRGK